MEAQLSLTTKINTAGDIPVIYFIIHFIVALIQCLDSDSILISSCWGLFVILCCNDYFLWIFMLE